MQLLFNRDDIIQKILNINSDIISENPEDLITPFKKKNMKTIKMKFKEVALSFLDHNSQIQLTTEYLRKAYEDKYTLNHQQDASEFLQSILDDTEELKDLFRFKLKTERRCTNEDCHHVYDIHEQDYFIYTKEFLSDNVSINCSDLLENLNSWKLNGNECIGIDCKKYTVEEKFTIPASNRYFAVSLKLFDYNSQLQSLKKRNNVFIDNVPCSSIFLNNKMYRPVGGINHIGPLPNMGHYTCYFFKQNKWFKADDTNVLPIDWPKQSKTSSLYVLLFERVIP